MRDHSELPELQNRIEDSVSTDEARQEFSAMKSYAQVLKEEGMAEGIAEGEIRALRRTLAKQLHQRFAPVLTDVLNRVNSTSDVAQLEMWLERVPTAETLEDIGILEQ